MMVGKKIPEVVVNRMGKFVALGRDIQPILSYRFAGPSDQGDGEK